MTTLFLIVDVLEQCKQGKCFPAHESEWPREELVKVLNFSGIMGVPQHYTHEQIIQLLLDHLNVQRPFVYALCTEHDLILDSQSVQVHNSLLHFGPYSKVQKLEHTDCRHVWNVFRNHNYIPRREFAAEPAAVTQKQVQILELEKEVYRLKKKIQESDNGRLAAQFNESEKLLKVYQAQVKEERRKEMAVREQNLKLVRDAQTLEAQKQELMEQLATARKNLGSGSSISEIAELKKRLEECEKR